MKFIKSVVAEMKLVTWPNPKEAWYDFIMVIEFTAFYLFFIAIFDWAAQNGITNAVRYLLPIIPK